MEMLAEIVKRHLLPGSAPFLVVALTLGVGLLFGRGRAPRWGRAWLSALVLGYWILGSPWFAAAIEDLLDADCGRIEQVEAAAGAQAIVVLGGGTVTFEAGGRQLHALSESSAFRALEAARLYRLLDVPWVVASGGLGEGRGGVSTESLALREALVDLGVPSQRIVLESTSEDTRQQALRLADMLEALGVERFVLVTSPSHMARAQAAFRALGMDPIPSVARHADPKGRSRALSWLPDQGALSRSQMAMRELLALGYYSMRGWLAPR